VPGPIHRPDSVYFVRPRTIRDPRVARDNLC
jgi:hypothetical protein